MMPLAHRKWTCLQKESVAETSVKWTFGLLASQEYESPVTGSGP